VRFNCVLLCEAVTARDGLINVLGGGVTHYTRPDFPAPIALWLAVGLALEKQSEIPGEHRLRIRIKRADDGRQIFQHEVPFTVQVEGDVDEGLVMFGIPIEGELPAPGKYRLEVEADDDQALSTLGIVASGSE